MRYALRFLLQVSEKEFSPRLLAVLRSCGTGAVSAAESAGVRRMDFPRVIGLSVGYA